jgi:hypothetical protein
VTLLADNRGIIVLLLRRFNACGKSKLPGCSSKPSNVSCSSPTTAFTAAMTSGEERQTLSAPLHCSGLHVLMYSV